MMNFFFFNDTATTEIYTLSLHDALPILIVARVARRIGLSLPRDLSIVGCGDLSPAELADPPLTTLRQPFHEMGRSEEHTSELQSRQYLVCRLLLEKK